MSFVHCRKCKKGVHVKNVHPKLKKKVIKNITCTLNKNAKKRENKNVFNMIFPRKWITQLSTKNQQTVA